MNSKTILPVDFQVADFSKRLPVNLIMQSNEHEKFIKMPKFNRSTRENILKKRKFELDKYGQYKPVELYWDVDYNQYFILDGQHRVEVLTNEKNPIVFYVNPKVTNLIQAREYVVNSNNFVGQHNTTDIITRNQDNPDYKIFKLCKSSW
jgi:hypothetical protein